jgi:hypothetical protein
LYKYERKYTKFFPVWKKCGMKNCRTLKLYVMLWMDVLPPGEALLYALVGRLRRNPDLISRE